MKKVSVICMSFLSVLLIIFTAKFSSKNVSAVDPNSTSNITSTVNSNQDMINNEAETRLQNLMAAAALSNSTDSTTTQIAEASTSQVSPTTTQVAEAPTSQVSPTTTQVAEASTSQVSSTTNGTNMVSSDGEILTTASFVQGNVASDKTINDMINQTTTVTETTIAPTLEATAPITPETIASTTAAAPETTLPAVPTIDSDIVGDLVEIMGRYLRTDIGSPLDMIIMEGETPSAVIMTNRSGDENLFANLNDGDVIVIKTVGIEKSYPGEADVYGCEKRENGTLDTIDSDKLQSLRDLGFISK